RADARPGDRAARYADVEAGARGGRILRHAEDILPRGAEVGTAEDAGAAARALQVAKAPLPLDAELGRLVARHLHDQALDEHLRAAHVELVDHRAQVPV